MKLGELGKTHRVLIDALADMKAGRMTSDELTSLCYNWSYHYTLKDFKSVALPITPDYMLTYWKMSPKEKRKIWQGSGKLREKVLAFITEKHRVETGNDTKVWWLRKMLLHFEKQQEVEKVTQVRLLLHESNRKEE